NVSATSANSAVRKRIVAKNLFYAKRTQFSPFLAQKRRFKANSKPNEPKAKPIIWLRLALKSEYQNPKSCPPQADLPALVR
ncbi:MAG: hypothetical protein JW804_04235, partial [Sedimentisphaerales bacterium]|nr:hypothetical protein [Sedimentisphaerales bacterium]